MSKIPRFFQFFAQRVNRLPSFRLRSIKFPWPGDKLRLANRILLIVLVGLSAYLSLDLIRPRSEETLSVTIDLKAGQDEEEGEAPQNPKPYSSYARSIGGWPLFRLRESSTPKSPEVQRPAVALNKLMANLNLMGIVGGKEPQAIIWDRQSKRTYYLKEGQFLDEIMIQEIKKGEVILKYKDETIELVL